VGAIQDDINSRWIPVVPSRVKETPVQWMNSRISIRICNFLLIPVRIITTVADAILGLLSLPMMLCGKDDFVCRHLNAFSLLLASPYEGLLCVLNPEASFYLHEDERIKKRDIAEMDQGIEWLAPLPEYVLDLVQELGQSSAWTLRILSRVVVIFLILTYVVKRATELLISIVAVPLSLIFLGRINKINKLAYQALQFPGLVINMMDCVIFFCLPTLSSR
jgi:hypothetical protein